MKLVEDYILKQPENFRMILFHLILIIEKEITQVTLEFKYGIPYYYLNKKPFCYLAPNHKKKYVDLGFAKGFQLNSNLYYLVSENRNTVKSLRYYSLEEINYEILIEVLKEASLFNK